MVVDEDPFPLVSIINTSFIIDLKEALTVEKDMEHAPIPKIKKV